MTIKLRVEFELAIGPGSLWDCFALPHGRAVALICVGTDFFLVRIYSGGMDRVMLDPSEFGTRVEPLSQFQPPALCRMGAGFAVVAAESATRWRSFDDEPRRFRRLDRFPKNSCGFTVIVTSGASSDEDNAALLFLHEPQLDQSVTRYALLRLEETDATCRWEWLQADGDPPWLATEDLPIPEGYRTSPHLLARQRPILFHGDWRGGRLRLFTVGLNGNYERWGMDYSIDAEVRGGKATIQFEADENSYGTYSSSGRYLILSPFRSSGPRRGASRLLDLETRQLHTVTLPRGFAKFQVADHAEGLFWLKTRRGEALRLVACSSIGSS